MKKLSLFIGLFLASVPTIAQDIEQMRFLAGDYQAQPLEQAVTALSASNAIAEHTQVEYKAGQSVTLRPGFEAKVGSVFTAHTGAVSLLSSDDQAGSLLSMRVYPNPFSSVVAISYVLTKPGRTSLQIMDTEGRQIGKLVDDQYQEAGRYAVEWKCSGISAGSYVCILKTGSQRLSKHIIKE